MFYIINSKPSQDQGRSCLAFTLDMRIDHCTLLSSQPMICYAAWTSLIPKFTTVVVPLYHFCHNAKKWVGLKSLRKRNEATAGLPYCSETSPFSLSSAAVSVIVWCIGLLTSRHMRQPQIIMQRRLQDSYMHIRWLLSDDSYMTCQVSERQCS